MMSKILPQNTFYLWIYLITTNAIFKGYNKVMRKLMFTAKEYLSDLLEKW